MSQGSHPGRVDGEADGVLAGRDRTVFGTVATALLLVKAITVPPNAAGQLMVTTPVDPFPP